MGLTRPRRQTVEPLTPCMKFYLMVGAPDTSNHAPVRLAGWLDCLLVEHDALASLWQAHRGELTAEAKAARFVPAGVLWFERWEPCGDLLPPDAERAAWSEAFCERHGY